LPAHPVHPAARAAAPGTDPDAQYAVHQGSAEGPAALVARIAALGVGGLRSRVDRVLGETRGGRDEAHDTAFGAGPEKGALGSAQHLDPLEIENPTHESGAEVCHRGAFCAADRNRDSYG
jgi:hypothetical protein